MYYGVSSSNLQKMYVKGSLKNQNNGFVLQLTNQIDSGTVSGIAKLTVDGEERSLEGATIELRDKVRQVGDLSWSSPLYVPYGSVMTLYVPEALEPGEHTISLTVRVPELGQLTFPITDEVA